MPDKEQATKLLGFRDENGSLVCPADVVDPSKSYTCHVGAEDGSFEPTEQDLKAIGDLFKAVGLLSSSVTKVKGKGGTTFYNKKGVVICRVVEGAPPAPKKPEPKPEPPPLAPEPKPEPPAPAPAPEPEQATAKASVKVETKKAPAKKAPVKKGRGRK